MTSESLTTKHCGGEPWISLGKDALFVGVSKTKPIFLPENCPSAIILKILQWKWKIIKGQWHEIWHYQFSGKMRLRSCQTTYLPASSSEFNSERTFSSPPNSAVNLSSFSRSTNDFTAEKALSLTGEESLDDARSSFIVLNFFPALESGDRFKNTEKEICKSAMYA